jgi:hypothetical protein
MWGLGKLLGRGRVHLVYSGGVGGRSLFIVLMVISSNALSFTRGVTTCHILLAFKLAGPLATMEAITICYYSVGVVAGIMTALLTTPRIGTKS